MRLRSPTSKSNFNFKLSPFDVFWAGAMKFIALALRDPVLLEPTGFPRELPPTYQYALVTIACSILAFLLFKVNDRMTHFFSVHDVLAVCGAVAVTVVSSSAMLFILTRMEGVPRSTPLIYGLVLGSGMIVARTAVRALHKETPGQRDSIGLDSTPRHLRRVLLIGVDRFSAMTIKLTDHQHPRTVQVVAALDAREALLGRSISGVKIVGQLPVWAGPSSMNTRSMGSTSMRSGFPTTPCFFDIRRVDGFDRAMRGAGHQIRDGILSEGRDLG